MIIRFNTILGGSALALLSAVQSVSADITPKDVWQDWRSYMQGTGYQLTGNENIAGDTLTVTDIRLESGAQGGQGETVISMNTLSFEQNPDGSVAVIFPALMPVSVEAASGVGDTDTVRLSVTLTQSGHEMLVRGTPTNMSNTYSAETVGLSIDQLTVGDETLDANTLQMTIAMQDVESETNSTLGAMRTYTQTASVGAITYDLNFKNPDEPATFAIQGKSADLTVKGKSLLPLTLGQVTDVAELLRAGMDASATITVGNATMTANIKDPNSGDMAIAIAAEDGTLTVETSADGISYAGTREGMTVSVQPPEFPFLLSFAMENSAFNLTAPAIKSDTPQHFALGLNLSGFTMSDMVWGMLNPQGSLPRDPASISLDMTGTATMLTDYMNMQNAGQMAGAMEMPARPESIKLNSLIIDALGARLTGLGAATFENADPTAQHSTLKPAGAVDFKLVGGNTLLNTLVDSGLLPAQTAMGARMVMAMFAVPGDGDDTLETKLEFTRSGAILANGQRIK
ncbi:hypothetical protein SAMN04488040_2301 [Sulfitobacter marinus]|uniref:DUF2125 domain-containing protein n=1 Tax=Sulfitobacter marinus TaxID=394264 RepID=A0A1I6TJS9_9RHOB|nr:DUF2125 domain-containing protein [Sulfitobacter marinus]SFS89424.1 hypothetical protein SAMN04488040_2301 [Sulfitobacter marinus]